MLHGRMQRIAVVFAAIGTLVLCGCSTSPKSAENASPTPAQIDTSLPLIGFVDVPQGDSVTLKANTQQSIGGWALWGQRVKAVNILIDGTVIVASVPVNISRPDVAKAHPEYSNANSGWGTSLPQSKLTPGTHNITVQVVSEAGQSQDLKTLRIDATK